MYAIQNGTLLPPDPLVHSIMDPRAYPGNGGGTFAMSSQRAMQRGIFNPHYLFEQTRPNPENKGGFRKNGEDPFLLGWGMQSGGGGFVGDQFGGGFDRMNLNPRPRDIPF